MMTLSQLLTFRDCDIAEGALLVGLYMYMYHSACGLGTSHGHPNEIIAFMQTHD